MNSDINHAEEMERAYHEAYVAMKMISPLIAALKFNQFCELVDDLPRMMPMMAGYFLELQND